MHTNTVPAVVTEATVVEPDLVVLGNIAVKHGAIADLAVSTDGTTLIVTHSADGSVSVIDTDAMTVEETVHVPGEPFMVAVAGRRAYVTVSAQTHDAIAVIDADANRVIATHKLADSATDVAISPDGTRVFAGQTGRHGAALAVINTFGRMSTIEVADGPGRTVDAVRVSPNGRLVYVATSDADSGKVLVVDVHQARVIHTVPIASPIRDVALTPDGALAYVASFDAHWGGSVDVIDTAINEITAKVGIGGAPMQMALSPDSARLYIAAYDHVAVLCTETNSVIDTITVTAEPSCVAVSPDGGRLYIADQGGAITVLSVARDTSTLETDLIEMSASTPPRAMPLERAAV
jgi:YVTN family beta-propeller protein